MSVNLYAANPYDRILCGNGYKRCFGWPQVVDLGSDASRIIHRYEREGADETLDAAVGSINELLHRDEGLWQTLFGERPLVPTFALDAAHTLRNMIREKKYLVINGRAVCLSQEDVCLYKERAEGVPGGFLNEMRDQYFSLALIKDPFGCKLHHYFEREFIEVWKAASHECPVGENSTSQHTLDGLSAADDLKERINSIHAGEEARQLQHRVLKDALKERVHGYFQRLGDLVQDGEDSLIGFKGDFMQYLAMRGERGFPRELLNEVWDSEVDVFQKNLIKERQEKIELLQRKLGEATLRMGELTLQVGALTSIIQGQDLIDRYNTTLLQIENEQNGLSKLSWRDNSLPNQALFANRILNVNPATATQVDVDAACDRLGTFFDPNKLPPLTPSESQALRRRFDTAKTSIANAKDILYKLHKW